MALIEIYEGRKVYYNQEQDLYLFFKNITYENYDYYMWIIWNETGIDVEETFLDSTIHSLQP